MSTSLYVLHPGEVDNIDDKILMFCLILLRVVKEGTHLRMLLLVKLDEEISQKPANL